MKNCKTFYDTQTASRLQEIIQPSPNPPPSDKMLLSLWKNIFLRRYTEIYRRLLSKYFKNAVLGRQAMALCLTRSKCLLRVRNTFGCIARANYFQCLGSRGL